MVTISPRHVTGEWREHVEKAPGDDHVVIDAGKRRQSKHAPANTCVDIDTISTTISLTYLRRRQREMKRKQQ